MNVRRAPGVRWVPGAAAAALAVLLTAAGAAAQAPGPLLPVAKLRAADPAPGDLFACALSLDGDTAAIGSLRDDDRGADSGSLYIYRRVGDAWSQRAKLTAAGGAAGDQLGYAVGLDGGRLAAGAPFRAAAGPRSGAVHLFVSGEGGWVESGELVPAGLGANDELGRAVAVSGATVAAGAPGDDERGSSAGAVWVFDLDSGAAVRLTAGDGAAGDGFGLAVALTGDRLLVGAPYHDAGGAQAGAAYLFERAGGVWSQRAKLTAADRRSGALFGSSVALSGSRAAVGARLDGAAGAAAGAVYVFAEAGGGWAQEARPVPAGLTAGDQLGISVALAGDALLAGLRFADDGAPDAGAAVLFVRGAAGWEESERLVADQPGAGDELGFAVALAEDVALAGAYRNDAGGADSGAACVFALQQRETDLSVSKTDGLATVAPGGGLTYTIVVANDGPAPVSGARLVDTFPPALACTWSCVAPPGAACSAGPVAGDLDDLVTLPAGSAVTYTAGCTVAASASGSLVNTARVSAPAGVVDLDPSNDLARDVTRVTIPPVLANLSVSKDDGLTEVAPGGALTYTMVVANAGPAAVSGATVADTFPPPLTCTWSCLAPVGGACTAGPVTGDIADGAALPAGASATYTAECTVSASASGTLVNTVSVTAPLGVVDPDTSDNTASDVTEVVVPPPEADLTVSKTSGQTEVAPGEPVVYTITVGNLGPDAVTGARVLDLFPPELACSWSCVASAGAACTPGPVAGDIDDLVDLVSGATAVYTATCTVSPEATGEIVNTASVTAPDGVIDRDGANDTAAVAITVVPPPLPAADLGLVKSDNQVEALAGDSLLYNLTVTNAGPDAVSGALVSDPLPPGLVGESWSCGGAQGSGDLVASIDLAAGASVVCTVEATIDPGFCGVLVNTASVTAPDGVTDPGSDPGDVTASDETRVLPAFGLCASKRLLTGPHAQGSAVRYELLLINAGPDPVPNLPTDELSDPLPTALVAASATADAGIAAVVNGLLTWNGDLNPGDVVTITVDAVVGETDPGTEVCNQGLLRDPQGELQPTDDPATAAPSDATCFEVAPILVIPALAPSGLALLALLLAAAALYRLRSRRRA